MKSHVTYLIAFFLTASVSFNAMAQDNADEEYQRKLEAWKKQKEEIERQNQEKMNAMGAQKGAKARFKAGNDYFKQGDYAAAVREFQEAVKLDPNYQKAYANLGLAYRKLGDFQSAITNYDKAINMPNGEKEVVTTAIKYKATLYVDTKEFKKAIETMDAYLKDNPNDDEIIYLKGKAMKDGLGQLKESIPVFQEALAKDGNNAKAYLELVSAYNITGDFDAAVKNGLKGLEVSRDAETTAALNFELADAYRKSGNTTEAIKYYNNSKTSRRWRESAEYWLKNLGSK